MVGDMIKRLRESAGKSQEDVGEDVGVHGTTVGRWEKGETKIPSAKIPALAKSLGASEQDLREMRRESERLDRNGRVSSRIDGFVWAQAIAKSGQPAEVRGLLVSLTTFVDEQFWIVTVGMEEFLEVTGLDEKTVRRWWPKMLESGFVESLNPKVEYVFALCFPGP